MVVIIPIKTWEAAIVALSLIHSGDSILVFITKNILDLFFNLVTINIQKKNPYLEWEMNSCFFLSFTCNHSILCTIQTSKMPRLEFQSHMIAINLRLTMITIYYNREILTWALRMTSGLNALNIKHEPRVQAQFRKWFLSLNLTIKKTTQLWMCGMKLIFMKQLLRLMVINCL